MLVLVADAVPPAEPEVADDAARVPRRGRDAHRDPVADRGRTGRTFGGAFVVDDFALLFKVFFLVVALVVLMVSFRYFREGRFYQGEYYFLLLTSFLGCLIMPSSRDLLMLFIALELVSRARRS